MRFVIIGGGPAGNSAATVAASLGADVTMIERDVIGGAAHLWDCIPSKALIATGGELVELDRAHTMGLKAEGQLDIEALRERVSSIEGRLHQMITTQLASQQVRGAAHDVALDQRDVGTQRGRDGRARVARGTTAQDHDTRHRGNSRTRPERLLPRAFRVT